MIPNKNNTIEIKSFDRILADAKLEYWKSNPDKVSLEEFCIACGIDYIQISQSCGHSGKARRGKARRGKARRGEARFN